MEASICNNCVNNTTCVYQSGLENEIRVVCESHEIEPIYLQKPEVKYLNNSDFAKDLCSICDFKNTCSLRNSEHFVYQCEQYM